MRTDTDKLVLMDNNILASNFGIHQIESLIGTDYRIDLNQGMDARLMTPEIADVLSRLKWIRFSCDQKLQIDYVKRSIGMLEMAGVKPYRIFVYMLVTPDLADADERVSALKGYHGINLYAQAERNERLGIIPNRAQLEFAQRYVYGGSFRAETWREYCKRTGFKGGT